MAGHSSLLYSAQSSKPDWTPTRSQMRDPSELAKQYGITYDANAIQSKFDAATKAQYDASRKEYAATENKYYNDMYNNQASSIDAIRKANAQAVATGASRGMQAANELSSVLGMQQTGAEGATKLAVDKNLLTDKEQAAYAQNSKDAMTTANSAGATLGNLNANIYAADTQFDVGQMDYYARLDTALKQLMGTQEQAEATRYNADQNLAGNKYSADANAAAQRYAADQNYAGQKYSADSRGSGGGYSTGNQGLDDALNKYKSNGNKEAYMATLIANGYNYGQALAAWGGPTGGSSGDSPVKVKPNQTISGSKIDRFLGQL